MVPWPTRVHNHGWDYDIGIKGKSL